jgi:stalled ribosome rescue protein Dom34
MALNAGLWIDHREARIVMIPDSGEAAIRRLESNVEKHVRSTGGSRSSCPYGPQDVAAGDVQERRLANHLNAFYKEVIEHLRDVDAIYLFGPGEAKTEFQKQIKNKKFRERIVAVETSDKMTDNQLVAKVRKYFNEKAVT